MESSTKMAVAVLLGFLLLIPLVYCNEPAKEIQVLKDGGTEMDTAHRGGDFDQKTGVESRFRRARPFERYLRIKSQPPPSPRHSVSFPYRRSRGYKSRPPTPPG
ncbi:hypothetical protein Nepgr_025272 [Nepenthes gracilis]|uniref:Uncharacterized protein n=1 Tax=Nepenthes gracilis TaxID=150966 RepID=A0AAD3Y0T6_NEPGR|nr:hypothetical protein Nepgr_025272 [Nepenthes gracilis]